MRIDGWEDTLYAYLEAGKTTAFVWGETDCALWASTFVDLITGSNWAADWRGLYATEEEAQALMVSRGFDGCEAIADAALTVKPLKMAARGDLVLLENGALGICAGRLSYFLAPERGLVPFLTSKCKKAWAV